MSSSKLHASCLCGAVRWEVDGPFPRPEELGEPLSALAMSHCHCSRCRKAHGAPYATYVTAREGQLRITQGRDGAVRHAPSPATNRSFCGACGSVVPDGVAWNGFVSMPAGPFLELDLGLTPQSHIFVGSKAPWVTLPDDGLPRFDTYPEALGAPVMETRLPLDPPTGEPRGSCLCGAVTFVVTAPPIRCRACHCSRCRRAGAAACGAFLVVPHDGVRFTRGEELVVLYKLPEARYFGHAFCRACGSMMPRRDRERGITMVAMGSLDDDPGVRPEAHIYVGSKAAWDVIPGRAPCYEESAPA